jgi:hypothetical protein
MGSHADRYYPVGDREAFVLPGWPTVIAVTSAKGRQLLGFQLNIGIGWLISHIILVCEV